MELNIVGYNGFCIFAFRPFLFTDLPVRYKAQVVEKFMLVERLKEEKTQIKAEMKNFLVFYLDKILPSLREKKESVNQRIGKNYNNLKIALCLVSSECLLYVSNHYLYLLLSLPIGHGGVLNRACFWVFF